MVLGAGHSSVVQVPKSQVACGAREWSAGAVKLLGWGKTELLCDCWKDLARLEYCLE